MPFPGQPGGDFNPLSPGQPMLGSPPGALPPPNIVPPPAAPNGSTGTVPNAPQPPPTETPDHRKSRSPLLPDQLY